MGIILMLTGIFIHLGESMVVRRYGKKYDNGGMFFNAIICLFSVIFFVATDKGGLCFPTELVLYGLVSSAFFAIGFYAMYAALRLGSFVITGLINSFSGVVSIFYGIFVLNEGYSFITFLAIGMVFLSLVLIRYKKTDPAEKKALSAKWLFWTLASLISNSLITVISREQQLYFSHAYDNEFMIISLAGAFVSLVVLGFLKERGTFKKTVKSGLLYGMAGGLLNGGKNLANLLLLLYMPISISTPVKTGLNLIISFTISFLFFKERFNKQQIIGVGIGAVALVLFNFA